MMISIILRPFQPYYDFLFITHQNQKFELSNAIKRLLSKQNCPLIIRLWYDKSP